jgi:LysR family transcriptional regulator, positive regulator for ilvC
MDLYSLKLFLHLADTLHFGRTSQACAISPSALSRTIRRLEDEIGERLFVRDKRSAELTEVGRLVRAFAQDTIERWDLLVHSLGEGETHLKGEVSIFSSVTGAYSVLNELFALLRSRHPDVHIRLQTGDPADALAKVQTSFVDVTVAAHPGRLPANVEFKSLLVTPLVFIAPRVACETRELTRRVPIPWERVPMILSDDRALSRRRVDSWFRGRGARPLIYAEVVGHEAILPMVHLGCGVGVVPRIVMETSLLKDDVHVLDVEPALDPYDVGLAVHRRRLGSPIVKAVWEAADELARGRRG